MWRLISKLLQATLLTALLAPVAAEDVSNDDLRSLDDQVQEVKTELLNISAELEILEERLLYPSSTQLSVYLSMQQQRDLHLHSVDIRINNEPATQHIYGIEEMKALWRGGLQNLYRGNVVAGTHELSVTIVGEHKDGTDFRKTGRHVFTKGVAPKALQITLAQAGRDDNGILIGDR